MLREIEDEGEDEIRFYKGSLFLEGSLIWTIQMKSDTDKKSDFIDIINPRHIEVNWT